jgi:hypothetical protein
MPNKNSVVKTIMRHSLQLLNKIICNCFDKSLFEAANRVIKSLISNHTFLSDLEGKLNWLKTADELQIAENIDLKKKNFYVVTRFQTFTQFVVKQFRYSTDRSITHFSATTTNSTNQNLSWETGRETSVMNSWESRTCWQPDQIQSHLGIYFTTVFNLLLSFPSCLASFINFIKILNAVIFLPRLLHIPVILLRLIAVN